MACGPELLSLTEPSGDIQLCKLSLDAQLTIYASKSKT